MKNIILSMALPFMLLSVPPCNSTKKDKAKAATAENVAPTPVAAPTAQEEQPLADTSSETTIATPYVDSFKIEMDSLMTAKIALPPIYNHEVVAANDEATAKFYELSKACHGKMKILVNSELVVNQLISTIKTVSTAQSDLLLLIDKTYSMYNDIANVKAGLSQIIETLKKFPGTRLAIAFYGDKNVDGMQWYTFKNFETDYDLALAYLNSVQVYGGGDIPESVYDAIMLSLDKDFWKSSKKCNIILVGDAPPLEKPLSDFGLTDVVKKAKDRKVEMNFYPILIMPNIKEVVLPETEIETFQPLQLSTSVYPNPTRSTINVGLAETSTYTFEIYNVKGELIVTEEKYGIFWSKNLDDQPDGMYILRVIKDDHKYEVKRFILQH